MEEASNSHGNVGVAVGKSKKDLYPLTWALDRLVSDQDTIFIIHVRDPVTAVPTPMGNYIPINNVRKDVAAAYLKHIDSLTDDLLLPVRKLCDSRKVKAEVKIVEDTNIALGIVSEATRSGLTKLVMRSPRHPFRRMMSTPNIAEIVTRSIPESCSLYVMSGGKITLKQSQRQEDSSHTGSSTIRHARDLTSASGFSNRSTPKSCNPDASTSSNPPTAPSLEKMLSFNNVFDNKNIANPNMMTCQDADLGIKTSKMVSNKLDNCEAQESRDQSPKNGSVNVCYGCKDETDVYVGKPKANTELQDFTELNLPADTRNFLMPEASDNCKCKNPLDGSEPEREEKFTSEGSEKQVEEGATITNEQGLGNKLSSALSKHDRNQDYIIFEMPSKQNIAAGSSVMYDKKEHSKLRVQEQMQSELKKMKDELACSREQYNAIFQEALAARKKVEQLQLRRAEEKKILEEAKAREELALAMVAEEKARYEAALREAETSKNIAEMETRLRNFTQLAVTETQSKDPSKTQAASVLEKERYRKYTLEEIDEATDYLSETQKIGEGGFGSVYRGTLHHTQVAIKVLHPDAAQGWNQFRQEVEVLCRIRHPHIVLLLGACPEIGCLVYEYMANGNLEDRLFRRGGTSPLQWPLRFKIAWEVAKGLFFLHSFTPEPLVHRDLKPANILLDENFVSKISDVGHARLIPSSATCSVTNFKRTSIAGTVWYIDPEYQRTGKLRTKSDIYALGILFLQILTGRNPDGIVYTVAKAIEKGNFSQILDPTVKDWPVPEALSLAKLGLKCSELSHKDRPELEKDILPELDRLKAFAVYRRTDSSRHSKAHFPLKFLPKSYAK